MKITSDVLKSALAAWERCPVGEVVHVHTDGSCTTGTDGAATHPGANGWGDIEHLFDLDLAPDPWDCFVEVAR